MPDAPPPPPAYPAGGGPPPSAAAPRTVPALVEPMPGVGPARLTGPAERQQYSPLLTALLGGLVAFLVFQAIAIATMTVLVLWGSDLAAAADPAGLAELMAANADAVFGANAVGQLLGLGLVTLALTRLHSPDVRAYLRIGRPDAAFLALSAGGLLALMPFVSWLGGLARHIPLPEGIRAWDEQQAALVQQVLQGELTLVLALLFVAVTPAFCEEVLFRGYIQRNVERRFGVGASLLIVGLAFGLFHLRFAELIPLTVLGVYLAYVVWVSGSLWPGVLVHLINNGAAVVASSYAAGRPDPIALDELSVPWYLGLMGLALAAVAVQVMLRRRAAVLAAVAPVAAPSAAPLPSP